MKRGHSGGGRGSAAKRPSLARARSAHAQTCLAAAEDGQQCAPICKAQVSAEQAALLR